MCLEHWELMFTVSEKHFSNHVCVHFVALRELY